MTARDQPNPDEWLEVVGQLRNRLRMEGLHPTFTETHVVVEGVRASLQGFFVDFEEAYLVLLAAIADRRRRTLLAGLDDGRDRFYGTGKPRTGHYDSSGIHITQKSG